MKISTVDHPGETGITSKRGKPFDKDGVTYLPTYHPSFILRDMNHENIFQKDLDLFCDLIKGEQHDDTVSYTTVTPENKQKFLGALRGDVSLDAEMSCLYPWGDPIYKKDKLVGTVDPKVVTLGFGTAKENYIIQLHEWNGESYDEVWDPGELEELFVGIEERLKNCFLIAQNGKFDFLWLWVHYGLKWYQYFDFDTMLAHYILDENDRHGLDHIAMKYLGVSGWDVDLPTKQGKNGYAKQASYQAKDLKYTRDLYPILKRKLDEDGEVKQVFDYILMPCSRLFTEIEYDGVYLDTEAMFHPRIGMEVKLRKTLRETEKAMCKFGNLENWGSSQQLGKFLFTKQYTDADGKVQRGLNLPVIEKTKKGAISTNESVIKRLDHPIADAILRHRGAKQQLSFFLDGWKPYIRKNRLHPSFKLHGTVTGRTSCEHPNLQQVPRDENIRSFVIAPPGWELIDADLAQIELRIAAELAQEHTLLEAFATGQDPHWITCLREIQRGGGYKELVIKTAARLGKRTSYADAFPILLKAGADAASAVDKEWKELRKKAKAIGFGFLFGMWWKKFKIYARDNYGLTISDSEAQDARKFFFDTYRFEDWHNRQRRYARLNGYVRSLSGRKRRLPEAMSSIDSPQRGEAERQSINSPVQGFASDLNLMSALQLRREFSRDIVRIAGTVHDSILVYVKKEHVDRVTKRLLEIMRRPALFKTLGIEFDCPIEAEANVGAWGKGRKWHDKAGVR